MSAVVDLTGQKFGKLIVVTRCENDNSGRATWKCKCDCGEIKTIRGKVFTAIIGGFSSPKENKEV